MIIDCVKLSYLDTLNQMYDLVPRINPRMPMFLDPIKYVVLTLFVFSRSIKS